MMAKPIDRVLVIAALIAACAALAVALSVRNRGSARMAPADTSALEEEVRRLRNELEQVGAELEAGYVPPPAAAVTSRSGGPPPQPAVVVDTVDDMRWTMTMRGLMPATAEHLVRCRDLVFTEDSSLRDKLRAVDILRQNDKLSDDIVREMIEVFRATEDPKDQQNIIRRLDDVRTPELADVLLEVSATSENSGVREEAVDSLSGYLPDPDLRVWLETVQADDPNERVRQEAARLLKTHWGEERNEKP